MDDINDIPELVPLDDIPEEVSCMTIEETHSDTNPNYAVNKQNLVDDERKIPITILTGFLGAGITTAY